MPTIDLRYVQQEFTTAIGQMVEIYAPADSGFRTLFKTKTVPTYGYKFRVKRGDRRISADISIHEKGKLVRREKSSEKFFFPGYWDEKTPASAIEGYEVINSSTGSIEESTVEGVMQEAAETIVESVEAFKRTEELKCAQAIITGVETFEIGDDITFPRKAASLVAYNAAHDFGIGTVNPEVRMAADIQFLISEGKANAGQTFMCVMGNETFIDFKNNPIVQAGADIRRMDHIDLSTVPQPTGFVPQGMYSVGSFKVAIYTYEGRYNDLDGNEQFYMDPKKYVMMPSVVDFEFVYSAVKGWKTNPYGDNPEFGLIEGERYYYKSVQPEEVEIQFGVRTAFMAITKNVDQIVTTTTKL